MKFIGLFFHLFHPRRSNNLRAKILHPDLLLAIFAVFIIVGLCLHQLPAKLKSNGKILGYTSAITVEETYNQINQKRMENGLPKLRINPALSEAALAKAQDMLNRQYWSHQSPQGVQPWDFIKASGYEYGVAGENLARDFNLTSDMVNAWMDSKTHRDNILHPRYVDTGIAVVDGVYEGVETTLVVQFFGRPLAQQGQINKSAASSEYQLLANLITEPSPQNSALKNMIKNDRSVLAASLTIPGRLSTPSPFSPLMIGRSIVIAVFLLVGLVLIYDYLVIGHRRNWRQVGRAPAHLLLLLTVMFMMVMLHAGRI